MRLPGYTVEREIPAEYISKVTSGEYNVYGGVIRDAHGQIVSHLQFASSDALSKAASQVSFLTNLNVASLALQGINLAVNIVGFAIVCRKLNRIDQSLQEMRADIKVILDKLDKAEMWRLFERRTEYLAQLENIESGLATVDHTRVSMALNEITSYAVFQRELAAVLSIDIEEVYSHSSTLTECLDAVATSNFVISHTQFLRGNTSEALRWLSKYDTWQKEMTQRIETPLREKPIWLLNLNDNNRTAIHNLFQQEQALPECIAYTRAQYEFCGRHGVTHQQFSAEFSDNKPFAVFVETP